MRKFYFWAAFIFVLGGLGVRYANLNPPVAAAPVAAAPVEAPVLSKYDLVEQGLADFNPGEIYHVTEAQAKDMVGEYFVDRELRINARVPRPSATRFVINMRQAYKHYVKYETKKVVNWEQTDIEKLRAYIVEANAIVKAEIWDVTGDGEITCQDRAILAYEVYTHFTGHPFKAVELRHADVPSGLPHIYIRVLWGDEWLDIEPSQTNINKVFMREAFRGFDNSKAWPVTLVKLAELGMYDD
jgi:hypothetical protein